jgi:hypothetical protein
MVAVNGAVALIGIIGVKPMYTAVIDCLVRKGRVPSDSLT